jgi:hypothetical protein
MASTSLSQRWLSEVETSGTLINSKSLSMILYRSVTETIRHFDDYF